MRIGADPPVRLSAAHYSAWADVYDGLWGRVRLPHRESLLQHLPLEAARLVLAS